MIRLHLSYKTVIAALAGSLVLLIFGVMFGEGQVFSVEKEGSITKASVEKELPPITAAELGEAAALERAELGLDPGVIATKTDEFVGAAAGVITVDGKRQFAFQTKKVWPAASITKLVTAITALTIFESDERVIMSEEAIAMEGDRTGFKPKEIFTVHDVVEAMLIVSSNDSAEALASHGDREIFMEKMNSIAKDIGMTNTTFDDPSGLSLQNLTTVEDIETLVQYIKKNYPEILAFTTRKTATVKDLLTNEEHVLQNINAFAGRSDFLGGKTGYLPAAGGNLVSLFAKNDTLYIVTVFGTADRFGETEKLLKKI